MKEHLDRLEQKIKEAKEMGIVIYVIKSDIPYDTNSSPNHLMVKDNLSNEEFENILDNFVSKFKENYVETLLDKHKNYKTRDEILNYIVDKTRYFLDNDTDNKCNEKIADVLRDILIYSEL